MKVIFMEDVPNVGKAGQIKDVADGYGKNYLLPHKLAMPARAGDIKNVEAQIKARARVAANSEAEMKALAGELEGKEIIITKHSEPLNLIDHEWHEIEALEDDTVFINVFSEGKN